MNINRQRTARGAAVVLAVAAAAVAGAGSARSAAPGDAPIVFARAGDLYAGAPGSPPRRITRTRAEEVFPAWSPDRTQVVFARDGDLYVTQADGSGERRLTPGPGLDLYPAWSPDGGSIAFSSNRGGREPELYVVRADGSRLRRLTRTPRHVQNVQPRWSPDGRWIVFASNRVAYWNFEVYRVRASDGGAARRLTFWGSGRDGAPGDDLMPSYSPDGRRIAFVSDRAGGYGIWTMRADGTGLRRVARHPGLNVAFPRWSPDGRSLVYTAFSATSERGDFRLWTVAAAGGRPTPQGLGTTPDW